MRSSRVWRGLCALPLPLFVALVAGVAVLLRLAPLTDPLHSDESGYLLVAQRWSLGGPSLFGAYWVDRPPLLIAIFKLGALLPWTCGIRVVALPFAAATVAGAGWAGWHLRGVNGGRWGALLGAAMTSTPLASGQIADGELFALPFVLLGVGAILAATHATPSRPRGEALLLAALAGLSGALAITVKQNFFDALVFGGLLLALLARRGTLPVGRALALLGAAVAGGLVVAATGMAYAEIAGVGVGVLWREVFAFRAAAFATIVEGDWTDPLRHASALALNAVLCGAVPLMACVLYVALHRYRRPSPVAWAIGATGLVEVLSMVAGGSYWNHYLLQLTPVTVLAAAAWAPDFTAIRRFASLAVASGTVCAVAMSLPHVSTAAVSGTCGGVETGRWLKDRAAPGDTATVLFGHAEVQLASGLQSPYPHLWSLPARTLDPGFDQLTALLESPGAPTWVAIWDPADDREFDPSGRVDALVAERYRHAADVCGHPIWRLAPAAAPEDRPWEPRATSTKPRPVEGPPPHG